MKQKEIERELKKTWSVSELKKICKDNDVKTPKSANDNFSKNLAVVEIARRIHDGDNHLAKLFGITKEEKVVQAEESYEESYDNQQNALKLERLRSILKQYSKRELQNLCQKHEIKRAYVGKNRMFDITGTVEKILQAPNLNEFAKTIDGSLELGDRVIDEEAVQKVIKKYQHLPLRSVSKSQTQTLRQIAKKYGIKNSTGEISKDGLLRQIAMKECMREKLFVHKARESEENDEKYEQIDDILEQYTIKRQRNMWTVDGAEYEIEGPIEFNVEVVGNILSAIRKKFAFNRDPNKYEVFIALTGLFDVSSYSDEDHMLYQTERSKRMIESGTRRVVGNAFKIVEDWFERNLNNMNNIVSASDCYAQIENIAELTVRIKYVLRGGEGYVTFKINEKLSNWLKSKMDGTTTEMVELEKYLYNPGDASDCVHLVLHKAGAKMKTGTSIAGINRALESNSGMIKVKDFGKMLNYYQGNIKICLFVPDEDGHFVTKRRGIYTKNEGDEDMLEICVGNVYNHYFLIKDTSILTLIDINDFNQKDNKFNEIETNEEINVKTVKPIRIKEEKNYLKNVYFWDIETYVEEREVQLKKEQKLERYHKPYAVGFYKVQSHAKPSKENVFEISEKNVRRKLEAYTDQDMAAGRKWKEGTYIDMEAIREIIEEDSGCCHYCQEKLSEKTYTIDRKDSGFAHVKGNCVLCCRKCNCTKKEHNYSKFVHKMKPSTLTIDPEEAMKQTVIYYTDENGEAFKKFEDYVLDLNNQLILKHKEAVDEYRENRFKQEAVEEIRRKKGKVDEKNIEKLWLVFKAKFTKEFKREHGIIFYAHNGGNFDTQFVIKNSRFEFDKSGFTMSNGSIISLALIGGFIEFRDTMKITGPTSLAKLCKDYKLDKKYTKTYFPHEFVKRKTLNYVGEVPEKSYWPKGAHEEFLKMNPDMKEFDLRKICEDYLRLDCVSLALVWEKVAKSFYDITGISVRNVVTMPGLAYKYFISKFPRPTIDKDMVEDNSNAVSIVTDRAIDNFIRKSVQGGRCIVQKSKFESTDFDMDKWCAKEDESEETVQERRKEIYEKIVMNKSYCTDFDACSLYPSAMYSFEYPLGKPYWVKELDQLANEINVLKRNKLSIIECDVTFMNPDSIICPLLSEKSKDGRLVYPAYELKGIIKTSIDLMEAVKYNGARISNIRKAIEWENKGKIFDCIKDLYDCRKQMKKEKNAAMSMGYKTLMNSGYGKFIQRMFDEDSAIYSCDTNEQKNEIDNLFRSYKVKYFDFMNNNNQMFINHDKFENKAQKPTHIGSFVLAYSKKIMNDCCAKMGGFTDWDKTFYYQDTDSYHINAEQLEMLKKATLDDGRPLIGTDLCQLHDDLDLLEDAIIVKSVFVRPKLYIDMCVGKDENEKYEMKCHKRAKGVPRSLVENLSVEDYEKYLEKNTGEFTYELFKKNTKKQTETSIKVESMTKVINQEEWNGRMYNIEQDRWIPWVEKQ
eukprot:GCRY01000534.1.p1 GENE.GCRY01000534.1~~GCRY01000534.1.p1  ORF type:complete len:1471 (-),score=118.29 GCRY01000534.1:1187-5599(-)